jgi:hypothetical protein
MDLSTIENSIEGVAFSLFRNWTKKASDLYPDLSFEIKDELILVNDLRHSINKALESLFDPEHLLDRLIPLWEIGFIIGFVSSYLNHHWYHEYVSIRSEEYKRILALSAVTNFLEESELANIEVRRLYDELIDDSTNLKVFDNTIFKLSIDLQNLKTSTSSTVVEEKRLIITCIEKIRVQKILEFVDIETSDISLDLQEYLTNNQIVQLIKNNEPRNLYVEKNVDGNVEVNG